MIVIGNPSIVQVPDTPYHRARMWVSGTTLEPYVLPNLLFSADTADVVIDKPRYDAFYKTNLEELLTGRNIDSLIITGTMTEVCCESTARSAMYRNYKVTMVSDLNFTRDPGKHEYSLKTFASNFGWVRTSDEILNTLG